MPTAERTKHTRQITRIADHAVDAWERLDARRPAPTFQARPAWAKALAASHRTYAPAPLACEFDDGTRAIVPLVRSRGPLPWRVYAGTPLGGYTTVLDEAGDAASAGIARAALRAVLARAGDSVMLTPWPLSPDGGDDLGAPSKMHETSVIDLRGGIDAVLAGVDGKFRRMAGQAERRGVSCAPSREPAAVDRFYSMLEESAVRWGREKPTFPKALLEALVSFGGADVEIWFANYEGEAIAGGVVLYGAEELNFWSAAMRSDFGTLRPSNALNLALLRAAVDRGLRWYNLGSSEGLPGVARFKEGIGAATISYRTWRRESTPYALYRALRRKRPDRDRE